MKTPRSISDSVILAHITASAYLEKLFEIFWYPCLRIWTCQLLAHFAIEAIFPHCVFSVY